MWQRSKGRDLASDREVLAGSNLAQPEHASLGRQDAGVPEIDLREPQTRFLSIDRGARLHLLCSKDAKLSRHRFGLRSVLS